MNTTYHLKLDNGQHIFLPVGVLIKVRDGLVAQVLDDGQYSIYLTNNMGTKRIYTEKSYTHLLSEPDRAEVNVQLEAVYRAWCQKKKQEKRGYK